MMNQCTNMNQGNMMNSQMNLNQGNMMNNQMNMGTMMNNQMMNQGNMMNNQMNMDNMMNNQLMNQGNMMNNQMNMDNMMNDQMMNLLQMNNSNIAMNQAANMMSNNLGNLINTQNNNEQPKQNNGGLNLRFRGSGEGDSNNKGIEILCTLEEKVSDVIQRYRDKTGDDDTTKKFIFNARLLNHDLSVAEAGLHNNSNIFVVVTKGIKGAY